MTRLDADLEAACLRRPHDDAIALYRRAEASGVLEYGEARRGLTAVATAAEEPSPHEAFLARDDRAMEEVASRAWREEPGFALDAIAAFVRLGEAGVVRSWIREVASPSSPTYRWARVVDGAVARRDPELSLDLLDQFVEGRLPEEFDPFAFETDDVIGVTSDDPVAAAGIARRFLALLDCSSARPTQPPRTTSGWPSATSMPSLPPGSRRLSSGRRSSRRWRR